ncbi:hypothetical protein FOZ60_001051 [Perkinsus olseni]|uniref:Uncharacterized protein n=1 Tax=Perkinsus olseni TaxID=32597 RepID=A0A7J6P177_PEROL|nr:hypothetical protein FOZ60_001051 [Perkinsus olseni]
MLFVALACAASAVRTSKDITAHEPSDALNMEGVFISAKDGICHLMYHDEIQFFPNRFGEVHWYFKIDEVSHNLQTKSIECYQYTYTNLLFPESDSEANPLAPYRITAHGCDDAIQQLHAALKTSDGFLGFYLAVCKEHYATKSLKNWQFSKAEQEDDDDNLLH